MKGFAASREEVKAYVNIIDTNEDGHISFPEFYEIVTTDPEDFLAFSKVGLGVRVGVGVGVGVVR
jgi:hypothetical protein